MKPVEFKEHNVVFAKNQPPYIPLPAFVDNFDTNRRATFAWRLTFLERMKLLFTGTIWHQVLTFNQPLQPQKLMIDKPEL